MTAYVILIVFCDRLRCPLWVCAVTRRRFPVGASSTRRPFQPEANGAVMEVTKWLKPSISVGSVARLVGIEGGVVSGVFNLESSGVEAPDWRLRHDQACKIARNFDPTPKVCQRI